jgi:hypothetical protein
MKTIADAQEWVVKTSLISSGCLILFFLLAPALFAFPLDSSQSRHLMQLAVPPFFGYLVMAIRSVIADDQSARERATLFMPKLMPQLLKGTFALYLVIIIAGLVSFFVSNSTLFATNRSISSVHFEDLSWAVCAALTLQASTFGALVAFIFKERNTTVELPTGNQK